MIHSGNNLSQGHEYKNVRSLSYLGYNLVRNLHTIKTFARLRLYCVSQKKKNLQILGEKQLCMQKYKIVLKAAITTHKNVPANRIISSTKNNVLLTTFLPDNWNIWSISKIRYAIGQAWWLHGAVLYKIISLILHWPPMSKKKKARLGSMVHGDAADKHWRER